MIIFGPIAIANLRKFGFIIEMCAFAQVADVRELVIRFTIVGGTTLALAELVAILGGQVNVERGRSFI